MVKFKFLNNYSQLLSLDIILLTLIICMNINKYFLGGSRDYIKYPIFLLFIAVSFFLNQDSVNGIHIVKIRNPLILSATILLCLSALLGSIMLGFASLKMALKLIVSFLVAAAALLFPVEKIRKTISLIIIYNLIYGIILVHNPAKAVMLMTAGTTNYLNITITLGLVLTISLCQALLMAYGLLQKKSGIIAIIISVSMLVVLSRFNARGSILLPIVSMLAVFLLIVRQKPLKLFGVIFVVLIVGYIGFRIYINIASDYALNRMLRLFNNTESESRLSIWSNYIEEIIKRRWFLFGGGTDASKIKLGYYPHNLYLQLIGEFGIVGALYSVVTTFTIIFCVLKYRKMILFNKKGINLANEVTTIVCLSGLLYYFLTFMKSFSFFDAYPLFVFYTFVIKCIRKSAMCISEEEMGSFTSLKAKDLNLSN